MAKIMTYKESALCPLCGMPLEKTGRQKMNGIPLIKTVCSCCGYMSYFIDCKDPSMRMKLKNKGHDVVSPKVKIANSSGDNSQDNGKLHPTYVTSKRPFYRKVYPFLRRKFFRYFNHLFFPQPKIERPDS